MDQKNLEIWHDRCGRCKKRKANMPKARCQIWYSLFVAKSKTALENADRFVDRYGVCDGFDPKVV